MIAIMIGSYKWTAHAQKDKRVYVCNEYLNDKRVNTYGIHEDQVDNEIMRILEEREK